MLPEPLLCLKQIINNMFLAQDLTSNTLWHNQNMTLDSQGS